MPFYAYIFIMVPKDKYNYQNKEMYINENNINK